MPYWRLFYHVVWGTKEREALIGAEEETVIRRSLKLTFEDLDVVPHAVGMMPDHVHVVVSAPPRIAPAELVKRMKGASTQAVNERVNRRGKSTFAWQGEYGIHSFGERALPTLVAYVTDQRTRHAARDLWPGLERIANEPSRIMKVDALFRYHVSGRFPNSSDSPGQSTPD